ncbi:hypothetical protein [Flexivirga lutea]
MSATLALVIGLSLAAAFSSALSALFEQREANKQQRLGGARNVAASIRNLVQRKLWVAGWLINHLGFFFQAAALQLGSLSLVSSTGPTWSAVRRRCQWRGRSPAGYPRPFRRRTAPTPATAGHCPDRLPPAHPYAN